MTQANRIRGVVAARADADPNKILNTLTKTFEDFKVANDKELADLKKGQADVVQTEQVDRINAEITKLQSAVDEANKKAAAAIVGGAGSAVDPDKAAHATAFDRFFRKGDAAANIRELEVKAKLTTQSDPDGGYLVPEQTEAGIDRVLGTVSTMRSLARVVSISGDTYKKLVNMGGAGAGWVGEEQSRPETASPTLREIAINAKELYANPAATQTLLDDARVDIAAWLADEVSIEFAEQEGEAFVTGDGVLKPRGVLSYTNAANASYAWGGLGFIASGAAAAFASSNPSDALIELYYALKSGYRNGASWLMSDAVMASVRKFKDGQGNYIWAPPAGTAEVATILGKPVFNDDNMPALAANAFPVAFGNFQRGYTIVDRFGVRVLRDPYTNKPFVHFYTTKRVGGGVTNFEAIKLLKCST
ncbi:phage major capsid protein [Brevundimonas vitis]|uniref:Phage major capsid protein n=1 Tax=Brevundimonas vitisensis TaxID=2800818 RepID=A0ABX7BSV0_9CAUL|nr:phage major capsid protein [Brevundimonas vitisensis]QQQ19828.1 phage major capsid protein [Brevundimonas vitisensis]